MRGEPYSRNSLNQLLNNYLIAVEWREKIAWCKLLQNKHGNLIQLMVLGDG